MGGAVTLVADNARRVHHISDVGLHLYSILTPLALLDSLPWAYSTSSLRMPSKNRAARTQCSSLVRTYRI